MPSALPRVTFVASKQFINRIVKWQHRHEFSSRSEAIVWMIKFVLQEDPYVPPKEERDLLR